MNTPISLASAGVLSLDIKQHGICFVLPPGATLEVAMLDLPGGALIQGRFTGSVLCRSGSLIIEQGAEFCGHAEAHNVYVAGRVRPTDNGQASTLKGVRLVAISEHADGSASIFSQAFAIHTQRFNAHLTTLRSDQ